MSNFIEDCLKGDALLSEIDDYIDIWHESDNDEEELSQFLGMTKEEYSLFVTRPDALSTIVAAHKENAEPV